MSAEPPDAICGAFDRRAADYDENAMHLAVAEAVARFSTIDGVEFSARAGGVVTATFSQTAGHTSLDTADVTPDLPYPRRHTLFCSADALAKTMGGHGFALTRHAMWTDSADEVLIAELLMGANAP